MMTCLTHAHDTAVLRELFFGNRLLNINSSSLSKNKETRQELSVYFIQSGSLFGGTLRPSKNKMGHHTLLFSFGNNTLKEYPPQ
jgi:hypothetical protein